MEQTLALIKPEAVAFGETGKIIELIELNDFVITKMKKAILTEDEARSFYAIHQDKSFFGEIIDYMTSGPVVALLLERENAVHAWRDLMGATNPEEAAIGTLRAMFGTDIGANALHGSDAIETAKNEIAFFFPE